MFANCVGGGTNQQSDAARELCESHRLALRPGTGVDTVRWSEKLVSAWDECWRERLAPHLVCASRGASYLRWRYVQHPRFRYELRFARDRNGTLTGLVVYRIEQIGGHSATVMRIVEFLAAPEDRGSLADYVALAAHREDVVFADFYCSSSEFGRALEQVGFRRQTGRPDNLVFPTRLQPVERRHIRMAGAFLFARHLRGKLDSFVESGRLYVTKSDSDQDRPN